MRKITTSFFVIILSFMLISAPAYAARNIIAEIDSMLPASVPTNKISQYFTRGNAQTATTEPERVLVTLFRQVPTGGYIYVAIFSLTHPAIVKALLDAHDRNVQVLVIADSSQLKGENQQAAIRILTQGKIPVKVNTYSGLMHLKTSVINGKYLTTGSYNYTSAASTKNQECLIVIPQTVAPDVVNQARAHFVSMWQNSLEYSNYFGEAGR